jgi:hypothetical protein
LIGEEVGMVIVELTEDEFKELAGAAAFFQGYFEPRLDSISEPCRTAEKMVEIILAVKERGFKVPSSQKH